MPPRILSAAAGTLLVLVAVTACSASPEPEPAKPAASASPSPAANSTPVATPETTTAASELTCESMISAGTVDALTGTGWSSKPKEFVIGDVALTDGLLCFWGDYSSGSDHGQLYGWSEITADDASRAQASLLASGWRREDGDEGIYFTEDPQYAMGLDEEGYGMTYLFDDGWVKLADTKQGLVLIEWTG